jgi:hypothetical protein
MKLFIYLLTLSSMLSHSQENPSISKIINSLNAGKFEVKINCTKNKSASDSISISKKITEEYISLNNNYCLFKLFDEPSYSVFLILNENNFKASSDLYSRKNYFEILVFSKISNTGMILYFSNSMYLNNINNKTEVTIVTSEDFVLKDKIIVNDNFEILKLANIQWFSNDLPIDVVPHTNYIIQDFNDLKGIKRFTKNTNYTEIELELFFKMILFEEKGNKIFSIKNEDMFSDRSSMSNGR